MHTLKEEHWQQILLLAERNGRTPSIAVSLTTFQLQGFKTFSSIKLGKLIRRDLAKDQILVECVQSAEADEGVMQHCPQCGIFDNELLIPFWSLSIRTYHLHMSLL